MKLTKIKIENFKSIKSLELHFSDNLYCLIGKNEIGKSNILQAISSLGELKWLQEERGKEKFDRILKSSNIVADFEIDKNDKNLLTRPIQFFRRKSTTVSPSVRQQEATKFHPNNMDHVRIVSKKSINSKNEYLLVLKDGTELSKASIPDQNLVDEFLDTLYKMLPSIEYFEREDFFN